MYLSNLKLWNFRKFGSRQEIDLKIPNLSVNFSKGLNLLIGENDSGKTCIVDAIKLVVKTHSYEWLKITDEDFFDGQSRLRIELVFSELSDEEAKHFTEWLSWEEINSEVTPYLRLILDVIRKDGRILPFDVRAGNDDYGYLLNAEAKEYLQAVYLRPLRDAKNELVPKRNSRLSQILQSHAAFKGHEHDHHLLKLFGDFNLSIEKYFDALDKDGNPLSGDTQGRELKKEIDKYLQSFYDPSKETNFGVTEGKLQQILEKLELTIKEVINPGLGTLNRLFMASELLHLNKRDWDGIRLAIIEEIEAHLHPQAQLQVMESLQNQVGVQLIVTTHSPNIGSKVPLEKLLLCDGNSVHSFVKGSTELDGNDYKFLETFLDVTKANLFFARGVIMVEGWSEELLLPSLAKKLKKDMTRCGVSIVNVGSTAFLKYSKIFKRRSNPQVDIPVAIVTDLDVKPDEEAETVDGVGKKEAKISKIKSEFDGSNVKSYISPQWTLEYCLHKSPSIGSHFDQIVKEVHSGTDFTDFDKVLSRKLSDKSLNKIEIAHRLAVKLLEDCDKKKPEIIIQENDPNIGYLIEAVKYVCG